MTNDQIMELADRCQDAMIAEGDDLIGYEFSLNSIIAFARLIAAAQREDDAVICEVEREKYCAYPRTQGWYGADNCAAAIRN